jgi:ubiquinone/menaquinone biosynthesis C-methylase UbiE
MTDRDGGHPVFATVFALLGRLAERGPMGERRRALLSNAIGVTVEVGAGTGLNSPHYRDSVSKVVATEPDRYMLRRLRRAAADARVPILVERAPAEALPLEDACADSVVCTLVLCSVPDQDDALREIGRVLKPGGRLLFLEHVRSPNRRTATWQDRIERPWTWFAGGCHPNRDTESAIQRAGFTAMDVERFDLPGPPILRPHVMGVATKPL